MNTTQWSGVAPSPEQLKLTERRFTIQAWIPLLVLASGIFIRVYHYLYNRGLWGDDSFLALNILERTYKGLASPPLDYGQQAPLLFLWTEKLFVQLLGPSEMAMRLFPLLCGIASLVAFHSLAKRTLDTWLAVSVSLALLAFSQPVIRYSVDIKQYETELLATILLLLSFFYFKDQLRLKSMFLWGLAGGIVLWFSYAAVFVLGAIGLYIGTQKLFSRNWPALFRLLVPFGIWAASFVLNYYLFVSMGTKDNVLLEYWDGKNSFAPLPPRSLQEILWYPQRISKLFENPLGLTWAGVELPSKLKFSLAGLLFLVAGVVSFWFSRRRQTTRAFFGITAILFSILLIASGLHKYPFQGRLLLFTVPLFFLLIGFGVAFVHANSKGFSKPLLLVAVCLLIAAPLFNAFSPIIAPRQYAFSSDYGNQTREGILYINARRKANESVYMHFCTVSIYRAYTYIFNPPWRALEGIDAWGRVATLDAYLDLYRADLAPLKKSQRAWVLVGNYGIKMKGESYKTLFTKPVSKKIKEAELIRQVLNEMGSVQEEFRGKDVTVYLCDFAKTKLSSHTTGPVNANRYTAPSKGSLNVPE